MTDEELKRPWQLALERILSYAMGTEVDVEGRAAFVLTGQDEWERFLVPRQVVRFAIEVSNYALTPAEATSITLEPWDPVEAQVEVDDGRTWAGDHWCLDAATCPFLGRHN